MNQGEKMYPLTNKTNSILYCGQAIPPGKTALVPKEIAISLCDSVTFDGKREYAIGLSLSKRRKKANECNSIMVSLPRRWDYLVHTLFMISKIASKVEVFVDVDRDQVDVIDRLNINGVKIGKSYDVDEYYNLYSYKFKESKDRIHELGEVFGVRIHHEYDHFALPHDIKPSRKFNIDYVIAPIANHKEYPMRSIKPATLTQLIDQLSRESKLIAVVDWVKRSIGTNKVINATGISQAHMLDLILSARRGVISVDSGIGYMAVLCRVPTVMIFSDVAARKRIHKTISPYYPLESDLPCVSRCCSDGMRKCEDDIINNDWPCTKTHNVSDIMLGVAAINAESANV